jgi:ribosomal protein S18 acetylase RimI-like enzyme
MDKILLRQIRRINPDIEITVIVRGAPVANDATMEDMEQIGMAELGRCMGNGTKIDGTVLRNLSREARENVVKADMVIAKGQANYETLYGCGSNIFYIFMCKCMLFMDRFKVPKFYGVLTHEEPEILFGVYGDEALLKRFQFRQILPEEADQAVEIENICFPPNEACPESEMRRRVAMIPNQFLVAVDRETGKLAGYVNGLCSDEKELRDDFFTDVTLHDPAAQTDFIAGLDVLPAYRGQGLAKELMRLYCIWGQVKGMHRVVLTAHEEKVGMYERMGFKDLGIASSVWGGGVWHEMEHRLER